MCIRVAYHAETFASRIKAPAAISLHEFESADVATALAGLKKNMIEAQHLIDQFIAVGSRPKEMPFSESNGIDLKPPS
jgi:hypothetical protein